MLHPTRILAGLVLSLLIGGIAYHRRSLTRSGWLGAVLTGTLTFGFGGWAWGLTLIGFFMSSTLLSRFRRGYKERLAGEKFEKSDRRDLGQTLANGGVGALLALLYGLGVAPVELLLLFAGVMATVTADTWATELGVLSRHQPRLATTFQVVPPGTSGGISLVGTLAAIAGAVMIGCLMLGLLLLEHAIWAPWLVPAAIVGGLIGSMADSVLGATIQAAYRAENGLLTERPYDAQGRAYPLVRGKRWMNNDAVNLLSSLVGGATALGLWRLVV